jgi:hypothetical protein
VRIGCLEVLCEVARGDERVYTLLCDAARKDPQWAGLLATFGDPRALPLLHDLAASYVPSNGGNPFADQAWAELYAAIQDLGEPTAAEQQKDAEIQAARWRRRSD